MPSLASWSPFRPPPKAGLSANRSRVIERPFCPFRPNVHARPGGPEPPTRRRPTPKRALARFGPVPPKNKNKQPRTAAGLAHVDAAPHRVAYALELFGAGERYSAVRRALIAKYSISDTTAENDIEKAYKAIQVEAEKELPQLAARVSSMLWRIAGDARDDGDYSASVSALARIARLHGLDAPTMVRISGGVTEEQKQLLNALS